MQFCTRMVFRCHEGAAGPIWVGSQWFKYAWPGHAPMLCSLNVFLRCRRAALAADRCGGRGGWLGSGVFERQWRDSFRVRARLPRRLHADSRLRPHRWHRRLPRPPRPQVRHRKFCTEGGKQGFSIVLTKQGDGRYSDGGPVCSLQSKLSSSLTDKRASLLQTHCALVKHACLLHCPTPYVAKPTRCIPPRSPSSSRPGCSHKPRMRCLSTLRAWRWCIQGAPPGLMAAVLPPPLNSKR